MQKASTVFVSAMQRSKSRKHQDGLREPKPGRDVFSLLQRGTYPSRCSVVTTWHYMQVLYYTSSPTNSIHQRIVDCQGRMYPQKAAVNGCRQSPDSIFWSWPMRHIDQAQMLQNRSSTGSPWNPGHEVETGQCCSHTL